MNALPEKGRTTLHGTITATAWHEFGLGKRLDRAIVDVVGKGSSAVFEELGVKSAQKT